MAASLGSVHLTGAPAAVTAVSPTVASTKSSHVKPTEPKATPDNRSLSSRDFNPPPPKKDRVEERSVKTKKLIRDGGVAGNSSGKEKVYQPAKSYGSSTGSWSFSPVKTSSDNPPVPATGGSQPPTNTHKLFKQSDFFLHKAPSSSKPKKANRDKQREKEKGHSDGSEKKKPKLLTPGSGSTVSNSNDFSRFNNSSGGKRENGEVTLLLKGTPLQCI